MRKKNSHLLLAWQMKDRLVVVVGGGSVATRKVNQLVGRGAIIRVIAKVATERLQQYEGEGLIHLSLREAEAVDLEGADLVFLATDQEALQEDLEEACEALGILYSRCDKDSGDFHTIAMVEEGALQIGVTTHGASPAYASQLAAHLRDTLEEDVAEKIEWLHQLRVKVLREERDPQLKRCLLTEAAALSVADIKRIVTDEENYSRFKRQQAGTISDPVDH